MSPFKSKAQRRKFYAMAERGEISKKEVEEWEEATGNRKLPERVNNKKKKSKLEKKKIVKKYKKCKKCKK